MEDDGGPRRSVLEEFSHSWECPACAHLNKTWWYDEDGTPAAGRQTWMLCRSDSGRGGCGRMSLFAWDRRLWVYEGRTTGPA